MKKIIFATLAIAAIVGCTKSESSEGSAQTEALEIRFTSGISSRVSGDEWEKGDEISIYAVNNYTFEDNKIPYTADSSGASTSFTVADGYTPIYLPDSPDDIDLFLLVAIYPHYEGFAFDESYVVNISDQSDLSDLDIMNAISNITTGNKEDGNVSAEVNFEFVRVQSLVKFNIVADDTTSSLESLSFWMDNVQIEGAPGYAPDPDDEDEETAGYFDKVKFGTIDTAQIVMADDKMSASIEMILFPADSSYPTDATLYFDLNGTQYQAPFCTALSSGQQHNFNVIIGASEITISGATIVDWDTESIEEEELKF